MRFEPIRIKSITMENFSLRKIFSNSKMKIKMLLSDVFEKSPETERLVSRSLPNCVGGGEEVYNVKIGRIKFFPEDIEKMVTMSEDEAADYRVKLIREKKYTRHPFES